MSKMSDNMRGALLMCVSMAGFSLGDAFIKGTGGAMPLSQLLVLRGVMATGAILIMAWYFDGLRFSMPRKDLGLILLRGGAECAAAYFFLSALLAMPLANVTALLQLLPLAVTLGSALVFREAVGWRRWSAICIGFLGMLLIVRPGTEGFTHASALALVAVVAVTVRDLATRRMSSAAPSLTVTLISSAMVTLFAGAWSLGQDWVPLTPGLTGLVVGATICIIIAYLSSVMVMRVGEVGFIAPFRYTALIWALLIGFFVFDEWPDAFTLMGAAIIVVTGIFTLWRETRVRSGPVRKPLSPRQG